MKGHPMQINVDETRDALLRAIDRLVFEGDLNEADLLDDGLTLLNRFEGQTVTILEGASN